VRFVRHHAKQFGVSPNRLGGVGGSSGAHLIGLVALLGAPGLHDGSDSVDRESASLQSVVLRAAPLDLSEMTGSGALGVVSFMERLPNRTPDDAKLYRAASPISHVSPSSPPVLLLHGDSDDTVPYQQSVLMEKALRAASVPVKLLRVRDGEHGPNFGTLDKPHSDFPQILDEMVMWMNAHLKPPTITGR
jgi:acetyl esterase/lipase